MPNRCEQFGKRMQEAGLVAALITRPENMRYLSGYTGEGALFVALGKGLIITDFRYTELAGRESPDCLVERTTADRKMAQILAQRLADAGIAQLAIEMDVMTVSEYDALKSALSGIELVSAGDILTQMRKVKDEGEIAHIVAAGKIACAAFDELIRVVRPGMTEREIARRLDYLMLEMGSEAVAFETIAASGPNGSLPHAVPSDRKVETGELLTLDFGAQICGYKCDMTRTIAFGEISSELRAIYDAVFEAQRRAYELIAPGEICKAVDAVAREYLDELYPGAFGHSLGHGVGLEIHEAPNFNTRCEDRLEAGHVMTVEPGIYIPGLGGCRIEDMAIITEDGYLNPITAPRALITV